MKILEYLDKLWDEIVDFFEDVGEEVAIFIKPLAKQIARNGGKLLMEIALDAVKTAEETGGSNEEKFNAARKIVLERLEKESLPVALNAVHGAIISGVASMKSGE